MSEDGSLQTEINICKSILSKENISNENYKVCIDKVFSTIDSYEKVIDKLKIEALRYELGYEKCRKKYNSSRSFI